MLKHTMSNQGVIQHIVSSSDNYSNKVKIAFMVALTAVVALLFANFAQAANVDGGAMGGNDVEQLEDIWDFFKSLVTGIGGKILALLALVAAFWQVFEQNWQAAAGAGMVAIALAFGPGVIEGLFDASVQLLPLL